MTKLVQNGAKLSQKEADCLNVVTTVYEQQRIMFESKTHSIPRRIVSLAQPWVRPIVRGKAHTNTEFGAKLHISLVNGYARSERLDFEPYNESVRGEQGKPLANCACRFGPRFLSRVIVIEPKMPCQNGKDISTLNNVKKCSLQIFFFCYNE